MNVPKAIELAIAEVLRTHANLPPEATIRAWQTLSDDAALQPDADRTFPMVEVRCSPPVTDENQATRMVSVAILAGTMNADDKDHAVISEIYGEVQDAIDRFFMQRPGRTAGAESNTFASVMADLVGPANFSLNGLTISDPIPPYEDRGAALIGITLAIHFTQEAYQ